jgi:glycosyltransferase involved in cell wall biosynthesis
MMNSIKVAHITTVGTSLKHLLLNQMHSLQQHGYDVMGVSSSDASVADLEAAGIRHVAVPMTRTIAPLADLVALWRLYRLLRRERVTIVHTHTPKPGLLGQLAARLAGVPVVINTIHGFYFHDHMSARQRQFYITLEKIAARCSDVILSQNREDMQTALRERICEPDKIKHLGNGIDLSRFQPEQISEAMVAQKRAELGIAPEAPVVGFVGRLAARRKGFRDFLAAGQQIAREMPTVRFLIIGKADSGKPDAVEPEVAEEYGIAEHCLFLGRQPNDTLPLLYRLMNVIVLPSLFEGMPRAIMEAAAMGVPAVVTDVKGNREVVEQHQTGFRVPLGDVPALAEAVLQVLAQSEQARQMGEQSLQMARQRFDERAIFATIQAEYVRLLKQKGLPTADVAGTSLVPS